MTKRRAILLWPGGHTHEERVNCPSPELEDTPRVICIGYAPHYAYFILTHHDPAGTAHYRLAYSYK